MFWGASVLQVKEAMVCRVCQNKREKKLDSSQTRDVISKICEQNKKQGEGVD